MRQDRQGRQEEEDEERKRRISADWQDISIQRGRPDPVSFLAALAALAILALIFSPRHLPTNETVFRG
jgi:hypothetical protein